MRTFRHILLSDGWWIEDEKAWFMTTKFNELFEVDIKSNIVTYMATVPELSSNPWRENPMCFKYGQFIFCLPDIGKCIWKFDLIRKEWKKIKVDIDDEIRIDIHYSYIYCGKCYLYAYAIKSFIELDCEKDKIIGIYKIPFENGEILANSIRVEDILYVPSYKNNRIYKFSLKSKETQKITVQNLVRGIRTICYARGKFYLTGHEAVIFRWDEENATVKKISFPIEFGVYEILWGGNAFFKNALKNEHPVIYQSVKVGRYIWLIPFKADPILYLDTENDKIKTYPIETEVENNKTVKRGLKEKYVIAYVKNERYLGIFSYKNEWIIEIDTRDLSYHIENYIFSMNTLRQIKKNYFSPAIIQFESKSYGLVDVIDNMCGYVYPNGTFEQEIEAVYKEKVENRVVGQCVYNHITEGKIYE